MTNDHKPIIGHRTTAIPLRFDFDSADTGHTVMIGPTDKGMSAGGAS
jgi:hypothetical protein